MKTYALKTHDYQWRVVVETPDGKTMVSEMSGDVPSQETILRFFRNYPECFANAAETRQPRKQNQK